MFCRAINSSVLECSHFCIQGMENRVNFFLYASLIVSEFKMNMY